MKIFSLTSVVAENGQNYSDEQKSEKAEQCVTTSTMAPKWNFAEEMKFSCTGQSPNM